MPLTLQNTQTSAVSSNTQVLVTANSNTYSSVEASNLQNVEFYYTNNGTIVNSWIESNATSTSTSTNYWIKLKAQIGASSSETRIAMGFVSTSTNLLSSSGTTGEAASLSGTYGQYDNGANVFNVYWNFAGSSLPSGWSAVTISTDTQLNTNTGSYTINNGFSITDTNGVDIWNGDYDGEYVYSTTQLSGYFIIETSITSQTNSNGWAKAGLMLQNTNNYGTSNGEVNVGTTPSNGARFQWQGTASYVAPESSSNGGAYSFPTYLQLVSSASGVGGFYGSSYISPTEQGSFVSPTGRVASQYFGIFITSHQVGASSTAAFQNWIRVRAYPPNEVLPTVTFGSLA